MPLETGGSRARSSYSAPGCLPGFSLGQRAIWKVWGCHPGAGRVSPTAGAFALITGHTDNTTRSGRSTFPLGVRSIRLPSPVAGHLGCPQALTRCTGQPGPQQRSLPPPPVISPGRHVPAASSRWPEPSTWLQICPGGNPPGHRPRVSWTVGDGWRASVSVLGNRSRWPLGTVLSYSLSLLMR